MDAVFEKANQIKNDLLNSDYSDDAGELSDKLIEQMGSEDDLFLQEEPYCFSYLDNPYTEEEPEPLTGDLYEQEKKAGDYYAFVVLSVPTHTPMCFDYTDDPESVENCDYYDGREVKVVVCKKSYSVPKLKAWKKAQIENFKEEHGYEPYLQNKF